MKKLFLTLLKVLGILVLLLTIAATVIYFKAVNYETFPIKANAAGFVEDPEKIDYEKLAEELVGKMTLREKIDQMYGEGKGTVIAKLIVNGLIKKRFPHVYVGENERLNIPAWVLSDGPRGARVLAKGVDAVTTFPVSMARGASWDVDLERRVHEVIAMEMRANGTNYAATPCINLLRHPGWGRAQETYGEDPWHLGEMGLAAVQGIEKHNVMACPKHFALNSIENSRWVIDVNVDERTLREVYLPHFKKIVQQGKPASIMNAYNKVNGEFCGENKYLLTDILKNEWGFEGFVSTDWAYGLYDGVAGVKAGLEVEMPWQNAYNYEALENGIKNGEITEVDIDRLVINSLKTRLKYAFFDDEKNYPVSIILKPEHIALAKEAAEKSMVLLKNENVLPYKKEGNKKIAVFGRLANRENTGDQGSSDSNPPYVITPYQGIKNYHEKLGNEVILFEGEDYQAAYDLAKNVDEVIIVVGFTWEDEGEYIIMDRNKMLESAKAEKLIGEKGMGGDRENLKLRAEDEQLILALAGVNENTVVTYVGGSAVDMSAWEDRIPAILFSWYAGMEGGNALANILYGDVNPSGKLPFAMAKNKNDYPFFNPYIKKIKYGYYHGYTLFEKNNIPVAYPFGFGLSYTEFEYSNLKVNKINADTLGWEVSVDLTNVGEMAGEEIVQLYVGFKNSAIDRPDKLLRGFKKIKLEPGETKNVSINIDASDLGWYNPENKMWEIEKMVYEVYVGGSSAENDLLAGEFK